MKNEQEKNTTQDLHQTLIAKTSFACLIFYDLKMFIINSGTERGQEIPRNSQILSVINEPLVKYENEHNKQVYSNTQPRSIMSEPMYKPSHTKSTGT